jgi:hypothetical protein
MLALVRRHPRYGYRRIWAVLRAEGWRVNRKRVHRLWRRQGLKVPTKQRKKRRLLEVSVKAVRGGGKWGVGTEDLSGRENRIFVLLHFTAFEDVTRQPDVFVIPAQDVEQLKESWFEQYAVYFSNAQRRAPLEQYRNAWNRYFV